MYQVTLIGASPPPSPSIYRRSGAGPSQARSEPHPERTAGRIPMRRGSAIDADLELLQVRWIDGRGSAVHERRGARGLGERDGVPDGIAAVEEDDQAIEPQRDAAVRRRAVFEGLEQEPELGVRLLGLHADRAHDRFLDVLSMDPDAPARQLVP